MKNNLIAILLAIPMLFFTEAVLARSYIVELIVFERPASNQKSDEVWDFSAAKIADNLARISSLKSTSRFIETNPTLHRLNRIQQNIAAAGYHILRTARWVQPARTYQSAPIASIGIDNSTFPSGFIRVYKTSLIYADLVLQLMPSEFDADHSAKNTNSHPPRYFISEKRRLKFREIHYFDHPKFGAILGVWPTG